MRPVAEVVEVHPFGPRPTVLVTVEPGALDEMNSAPVMEALQQLFDDLRVKGYVVDGGALSVQVLR